jgi:hypothetical protein
VLPQQLGIGAGEHDRDVAPGAAAAAALEGHRASGIFCSSGVMRRSNV